MVKTRAAEVLIRQQNQDPNRDGVLGEIREKAKELSESRLYRQIDRKQSPRKLSATKEKKKAKRDSMKFEQALSAIKKNLSKVADRNLPDLPDHHPPSLFDQIHDPIKSGEAKANLKPVVIIIED